MHAQDGGSPFVRAYLHGRTKATAAFVIFGLVVTIWAAAAGWSVATDLTTHYTETTGHVVSEGTKRVSVGRRWLRRSEQQRVVTFEYTINGVTGSGEVWSRTIPVGDTQQIWVSDADGHIVLEQPTGPGVIDWAWLTACAIGAAVLVSVATARIRMSRRIATFQRGDRQPDVELTVERISTLTHGKRATMVFHGVLSRSPDAAKVGTRAELISIATAVPRADPYPQRLSGFLVKPGARAGVVIVDAPLLSGTWPAELRYSRAPTGAPE